MKGKRALFIIVSFMLALLLSVSVYVYLSSLENKPAAVKEYEVIVASIEIPQYTKITQEMIETIKVLQLPADSTTYYADPAEIVGKYNSERILKGEQFFKSRILDNAENNLSLSLTGNNRAVSVMANLESGVTKLIKPGDYLDIMVFLPELSEGDRVVRPDIEKIFMQKILVMAVDRKTATGTASTGTAAAGTEAAASEDAGATVFYLTLSVPVFDVEKLALAEDIGSLKFELRPKTDDFIYQTEGAIWQEMLLDADKKMKDIAPTYQIKEDKKANTAYNYDKYIYYVVKKGDTLRSIAQQFLKDPNKYTVLQDINNISDPNTILTGTGIKIPVIK